MQSDLEGRRALVTGAQQGIGRACTLALAQAGADIAINWLDNKSSAEAAAADIHALGRRAVLVHGSVATSREAQRIVEDADAALGGLDILINNAGIFPRSSFLELAEAEWDDVHNVNLKGSFVVAQAVARRMISNARRGAIVNLSSSSVRGHVLGAHYAASKAGIIGLTRSMALALAPHGIRVNAVAPGLTDTAQPRYQFSEADLLEQSRLIPLGAMAQPSEIANIIVFLASDRACFITGEVVHANGGLYMA
jgi:3-oxoacyl-[acyl-carrier protein] reductase